MPPGSDDSCAAADAPGSRPADRDSAGYVPSAQGRPCLIADAKYKLPASEGHHADLYQMLAYCTAEGIGHGVLIYPKWERAGSGAISIRNSSFTIVRETIDLGGSVSELRAEVARLARRSMEVADRVDLRLPA